MSTTTVICDDEQSGNQPYFTSQKQIATFVNKSFRTYKNDCILQGHRDCAKYATTSQIYKHSSKTATRRSKEIDTTTSNKAPYATMSYRLTTRGNDKLSYIKLKSNTLPLLLPTPQTPLQKRSYKPSR